MQDKGESTTVAELISTPLGPRRYPSMRANELLESDTTRVADLMTRSVVCVRAETSVEELTAIFLQRGIGGIPVLDACDRLIGMVSKDDVLRTLWDPQTFNLVREDERDDTPASHVLDEERPPNGFQLEPIPRALVAELMTPIAFKLPDTARALEAASLMASTGAKRVVIVADNDAIVGIVSAADILRWIGHGLRHEN